MMVLKKITELENLDNTSARIFMIEFEGFEDEYIAIIKSNKLDELILSDDKVSGWAYGTRMVLGGKITDNEMWHIESNAVIEALIGRGYLPKTHKYFK